ncbi:Holliday junction resolvase RuvX [Coxiella endosymbiont of Amblyomma nuttalli]|uniref:Holliday junction resolvase RuvX n=1 Tax=Coxiella endosymbiont of Amblyomma nuttalli TaxID=2749996 RepID=UPI001BA67256|nr:Holliday junction resolvase RuvX [Coxiella endosymbiont of Amblyomma nuttalli]QTS84253.1 Holliday junction resolvase RuvX [Coxiella endosymbiont of Amblyomma nuttalli]
MPKPATLTALGFDFGMKRIGLAVGQTLTCTANPLPILNVRDGIPHWKKIETLIEIWDTHALVVGIPYNMDQSEQYLTFSARKFARKLRSRFQLPVYTVDERLTTFEAKRQWCERKKQRNVKIPEQFDSHAAKLILEQWLQEDNS